MNLNTVGERIAWARSQRKITQAELARRAGVSQSAIASYEAGHRGRPRELVAIARSLDANVDWLDTGEGDWEGAEPPLTNKLEDTFIEWATEAGVEARRLTAADVLRLPPFVQELFGTRYIPDIEIRVPGKPRPILVEIKGPDVKPDRIAPYLFLANQHPDEYAVFMADLRKPRLGVDEFLERLGVDLKARRGPGPFPGRWSDPNYQVPGVYGGQTMSPQDEADLVAGRQGVVEPRAAYGMEPILAWNHPDDLPEGEFVMVPRLDVHLSAGGGRDQVEIELVKENPQAFRAEWIRLMRFKPNKLAAMRASGDSMEPTIHDGDSLLIDTSQTNVVDGKVYALWYDGGERVKRLFRLPGGGLRIKSDNPAFDLMELGPDYAGHVRIIGRVVHRSGTGGL